MCHTSPGPLQRQARLQNQQLRSNNHNLPVCLLGKLVSYTEQTAWHNKTSAAHSAQRIQRAVHAMAKHHRGTAGVLPLVRQDQHSAAL
jgi:hypothetical protein